MKHNYHIAVVVGSLRQDSFNKKLAHALIQLAPDDFTFSFINIGDLPLYNQDDDGHHAESVMQLKAALLDAQGLLFVTPEYNRSIPGVLKNALDHGSRPYGHNAWAKNPAGVIGASVGAHGTSMAQQHLRNVLSYLDVYAMAQPEAYVHAKEGLFDADGNFSAANKDFFERWMKAFTGWVRDFDNPLIPEKAQPAD